MAPKKRKSLHGASQPRKRKAPERTERIEQTVEAPEAEHQMTQQFDVQRADQTDRTQKAEYEPTEDLDAYNKVFCTTELLEAILEGLSPTTIFVIQRVNRQFQAVILSSQRIKHKLFFRIDNKRVARWHFRYEECKLLRDEPVIFDLERVPHEPVPIPVMTSQERFDAPQAYVTSLQGSAKDVMAVGEKMRRQHAQRLLSWSGQPTASPDKLLPMLQRQSIEVELCFALGVRRPTLITFTTKLQTTGPLDIGDIIEEVLNTHCELHVKWRLIDGHISPSLQKLFMDIPKHFIKNLKRQTGLEAYLKPGYSSFRLRRFRRSEDLRHTTKKPVVRTEILVSDLDSDSSGLSD